MRWTRELCREDGKAHPIYPGGQPLRANHSIAGRWFQAGGATILVDWDDGLIHELWVLMRPQPVVTIVRIHEAVGCHSAGLLGPGAEAGRNWLPSQIQADRLPADRGFGHG